MKLAILFKNLADILIKQTYLLYKTSFSQFEYYETILYTLYLRAHRLIKSTPCVHQIMTLVNKSPLVMRCYLHSLRKHAFSSSICSSCLIMIREKSAVQKKTKNKDRLSPSLHSLIKSLNFIPWFFHEHCI